MTVNASVDNSSKTVGTPAASNIPQPSRSTLYSQSAQYFPIQDAIPCTLLS